MSEVVNYYDLGKISPIPVNYMYGLGFKFVPPISKGCVQSLALKAVRTGVFGVCWGRSGRVWGLRFRALGSCCL